MFPLEFVGLDLTPLAIWIGVDINKVSITVIINWGITKKCNGIDLIGSILKFEGPT